MLSALAFHFLRQWLLPLFYWEVFDMRDELLKSYDNLDDYFADHPEEYDDYVDDMAEIYGHEEPIDYPEDWAV